MHRPESSLPGAMHARRRQPIEPWPAARHPARGGVARRAQEQARCHERSWRGDRGVKRRSFRASRSRAAQRSSSKMARSRRAHAAASLRRRSRRRELPLLRRAAARGGAARACAARCLPAEDQKQAGGLACLSAKRVAVASSEHVAGPRLRASSLRVTSSRAPPPLRHGVSAPWTRRRAARAR